MLTPQGQPAGPLDKITLLAMWSRHLSHQGRFVIASNMGKPTFVLNSHAASFAVKHWSEIQWQVQKAHHAFRSNPHCADTRDKIVQMNSAIDYGDPQGDAHARALMAQALTRWYNQRVEIAPSHLLFTVGGAAAIHILLAVLHEQAPGAKVITPFPHYPLYAAHKSLPLHPVLVMEEPGYRLSAQALTNSINRCKPGKIAAFLFCDPNNPLGTSLNPEEWQAIATVLKQYPEVPIVLDEAYAEMRLDGQPHQSLLTLAPELYSRLVLLRSATKGLSAAGQRMAVLVTPNALLMSQLVAKNVAIYGHAPRAEQIIFAQALYHFNHSDHNDLVAFYAPQVNLALTRLKAMGAMMPDSLYKVEGTFYVLADLSALLGLELPKEVAYVLNKPGFTTTDEDIAYYLLFKGVSIAPLSYFGASPYAGFMRITCCGGDSEINALCDILQNTLTMAKKRKKGMKNNKQQSETPQV
jgi:aspartate/methionine/tyrosine aminotransferase